MVLGCEVWGLGYEVLGEGAGFWSLGCEVLGLRYEVWGPGYEIPRALVGTNCSHYPSRFWIQADLRARV
jgi:hypothetical protein